jgi:hypothetical protein
MRARGKVQTVQYELPSGAGLPVAEKGVRVTSPVALAGMTSSLPDQARGQAACVPGANRHRFLQLAEPSTTPPLLT